MKGIIKNMDINSSRLSADFYKNGALFIAPKLLGKILCRNTNGDIKRFAITETEAYCGEKDTACHAHKGRTPRTEILYREGGIAYIYLCYGIHELLNVVAGEKNQPEAVLIRAIDGCSGPGRLTKMLQIDRTLNGENYITSNKLWIEDSSKALKYTAYKRVGIDYAEKEDRESLWRFIAVPKV